MWFNLKKKYNECINIAKISIKEEIKNESENNGNLENYAVIIGKVTNIILLFKSKDEEKRNENYNNNINKV